MDKILYIKEMIKKIEEQMDECNELILLRKNKLKDFQNDRQLLYSILNDLEKK